MKKDSDHFDLLFGISELADLVTGSSDLEGFLSRSAELVSRHFRAPVCSIYLYDESKGLLTLRATKGLKPDAVNRIHMKPGEGLVGRSFEDLSVIRVKDATRTPGFKYFVEAGEDSFHSFLCVPIRRGVEKIGVLAVQHQDEDYFDAADERAIRAVVTQLAGSISNARLLMALSQSRPEEVPGKFLKFVKGRPAAGGYALGKAVVFNGRRRSILYDPVFDESRFTRQDFLDAVEKTNQELKDLQKGFAEKLPESASLIFTAHFMILKDKNFIGKMTDLIDAGKQPCNAVRKVAARYISIFSASPDAYMQEKAQDVEDLCVRILNNFDTASRADQDQYEKGSIAIARQVFPSDILKLVSEGIRGIILASGGVTSHVAILARSLQIPLVIAEERRLLTLPEKTRMLMDGDQGNIYINPEKDTLDLFDTQRAVKKLSKAQPVKAQTCTADNEPVSLLANINLLSEVGLARRMNAEGIGLYRTEFPFLIRATFPSEAEQYIIYKKLFDEMGGRMVTLRTLDAGGEKALAYTNAPKEENPELGLRSIRFSLRHRDIFESQVRAMLRAANGRENVRIMFPLVSSVDEFLEARQVVSDCMQALEQEEIEYNPDVAIGIMIELPSVLEIIDEFAAQADFFSIGTNDFVQYMLAADRANDMVSDHYIPYHPAVNRGLAKICRAAARQGIDVSVCGEMAHQPEHIPFLLGVGVRTLSVDPQFLYSVQQAIAGLRMADAEKYAEKMLAQVTVKGAKQLLDEWGARVRP